MQNRLWVGIQRVDSTKQKVVFVKKKVVIKPKVTMHGMTRRAKKTLKNPQDRLNISSNNVS